MKKDVIFIIHTFITLTKLSCQIIQFIKDVYVTISSIPLLQNKEMLRIFAKLHGWPGFTNNLLYNHLRKCNCAILAIFFTLKQNKNEMNVRKSLTKQ